MQNTFSSVASGLHFIYVLFIQRIDGPGAWCMDTTHSAFTYLIHVFDCARDYYDLV